MMGKECLLSGRVPLRENRRMTSPADQEFPGSLVKCHIQGALGSETAGG